MEIIETHDSFERIAQDWEDLAERTGAPPFLRPGWMQAWWGAFGSGSLEVVAVRRDGRIVGVVPLRRRGRVLESATNWHTPEFGAVAEDEQAVKALMVAVFGRRPRRASLWFLNPDNGEVRASRQAAAAAGYRSTFHRLERPPYVSIDASWSEFEKSVSTKVRSDLRRRWRLLEKEGSRVMEVADGRENLDILLQEGFRIEGSGWKDRAGTAVASQPDTLHFYTEVARWLAERGWLRLSFLRIDGRPIAFQYGIEQGGVHYLLKGGYDPAYKRFSPAKLLIHASLERAFSQGLTRFDFGGSEEIFKLVWTNGHRELVHYQGFAPSPLGLLDWAAAPARRYGPHAMTRLKAAVQR
jgi:CelD/BcsL family acetyltransferase involved in cellulose biosynthesis